MTVSWKTTAREPNTGRADAAIKRVCGALTSQTFSKVFCVREGYKSLFTSLMVDGTSCPEQWADLGSLYD